MGTTWAQRQFICENFQGHNGFTTRRTIHGQLGNSFVIVMRYCGPFELKSNGPMCSELGWASSNLPSATVHQQMSVSKATSG